MGFVKKITVGFGRKNMSESWMTCTTCTKTAKANPTGTCLGCQSGFSQEMQKDSFLYHLKKQANEIKEKLDANKERLGKKDDSNEY